MNCITPASNDRFTFPTKQIDDEYLFRGDMPVLSNSADSKSVMCFERLDSSNIMSFSVKPSSNFQMPSFPSLITEFDDLRANITDDDSVCGDNHGISSKAISSSDFSEFRGEEVVACPHSAFEYKLNDIMEPTPFRAGSSLQVSPYSNKKFVLEESLYSDMVDVTVAKNATDAPTQHKLVSPVSVSSNRKSAKYTYPKNLPQVPIIRAPRKENKITVLKPHQEIRWEEFYLSLLAFREREGHCHVPHTYPQDPALARWAKRQRYQYKLTVENKPSTLTADRLEKLESVGFIWDPQAIVWETRLQELAEYAKEYGDCNVPCRFAKNPQLGMWVKRQRRQYKLYKSGKFSRMSEDRFRILNDMGFVWEVRSEGGKQRDF